MQILTGDLLLKVNLSRFLTVVKIIGKAEINWVQIQVQHAPFSFWVR